MGMIENAPYQVQPKIILHAVVRAARCGKWRKTGAGEVALSRSGATGNIERQLR